MTERERLIELIQKSVNGCARNWAETIADYLLANGVIVPPCKVGDVVYRICKRVDGRKKGYIRRVEVTPHNFNFTELCLKNGTYYLSKEEAEKALEAENEKQN